MRAKLRYLRVSARKTRLVVDLMRGKSVAEAINILTFTRRSASEPVRKLIESAMANAEAGNANVDRLFVDTICGRRAHHAPVSTTCNGPCDPNQQADESRDMRTRRERLGV